MIHVMGILSWTCWMSKAASKPDKHPPNAAFLWLFRRLGAMCQRLATSMEQAFINSLWTLTVNIFTIH